MDSNEYIQKNSSGLDKKNQLYPVFLKLDQLELLLVGGGNVGLEKLHSLLANSPSAKVSIVAPEVKDEIKKLKSLNSLSTTLLVSSALFTA